MTIKQEKKQAFIGLRYDRGKQLQLETGARKIRSRHSSSSDIYKLKQRQQGGVEQDTFLNQVAEVETWMTPGFTRVYWPLSRKWDVFVSQVRPRVIGLDLYIGYTIVTVQLDATSYVAEHYLCLRSLNGNSSFWQDPVQKPFASMGDCQIVSLLWSIKNNPFEDWWGENKVLIAFLRVNYGRSANCEVPWQCEPRSGERQCLKPVTFQELSHNGKFPRI